MFQLRERSVERVTVSGFNRRFLLGERNRLIWLVLIGFVIDVIVCLPVLSTLFVAFSTGWTAIVHALDHPFVLLLLKNTVLISLIVTPACGVLGLFTAWCMERTNIRARGVWSMFIVAPLTVPLFVTSYAWARLGPLTNGFLGGVAIVTLTYYPIVFLLVTAALRGLDPALEDAARSLGCSPKRVFFRVVLPQLAPALFGGMLIIALDSLVEFDAFVALNFQNLANSINQQYQSSFSVGGAAILSCLSIVMCVLVLMVESTLRGKRNYVSVSTLSRRPPNRYDLKWPARRFLQLLLCIIIIASLGIPIGMIMYWIAQGSAEAFAVAAVGASYLLPATFTSVWTGIVASAVALAFAMPIVILVIKSRGRVPSALERITYLAFALPDMVAAVALNFIAAQYFKALSDTYFLLILAYASLYIPIAVIALRTTMGQLEPRLDDVAHSLGMGGWRSWWKVTVPLARPGIAAAGVLVFSFVLGDLATAQTLLPAGSYTLGTEFWANSSTVALAAAAPFAAVLMVLAMISTYILMNRFGKTSQ